MSEAFRWLLAVDGCGGTRYCTTLSHQIAVTTKSIEIRKTAIVCRYLIDTTVLTRADVQHASKHNITRIPAHLHSGRSILILTTIQSTRGIKS